MKANRIVAILLSILMLSAFVAGCGSNDQADNNSGADTEKQYVWKFAHEETNGDIQDVYVKEFKRVIEEKSDGQIQIEIYPVGQLGDATQQAELLQNAGIEFAIVSPGNTGTLVPENQLFSLHFLFSDDMDVNKKIFAESEALNTDLSGLYEDKNIRVLDYWPEGFMDWTSSKPLNTPADFEGFKMRTMPSPMIVAAYEAYGANPTPVPYMEVYSGLQLNMIEGQENPLDAIETMKFYEVQNYLTLSNHDMYVTTTATNPEFFDSLPEELQQIVVDTVEELHDFAFTTQAELNNDALEQIKQDSDIEIVVLTDEQRAAFKEASTKAYDTYVEMVGDKGAAILDKLQQEVAETGK